jgi:hypothetical protein
MINSPIDSPDPAVSEEEALDAIVRAGPGGALALASVATGIVVLVWLAFYLFVFLARVTTP